MLLNIVVVVVLLQLLWLLEMKRGSESIFPSWGIRMSTEMAFNLFNNEPNQWLDDPSLNLLPIRRPFVYLSRSNER